MIKINAISTLRHLLIAVLLSFPTVLLILPTGRRASFYVLLLCAIACIVCRVKPGGQTFLNVLKRHWQISLAMAAMLIAVLLHQLAVGEFPSKPNEKALQLAAFPLFLWTLLLLSARDLRILQWALIIGVALSSASLHWITQGGSMRAIGVISNPLIPFANLTTLMGFMVLLSIGWNERSERGMIALKILTWCASMYASYISGTRGSWSAFAFFIIIAISLQRGVRNTHKVLVSIVAISVAAGAMALLPYTKARIELAYSEMVSYVKQSDAETSIGIRLQLWDVSWDMFQNNPVFGIGAARYEREVKRLAAEGVITPQAGSQLHAHNDFLHALATLGIIGAIAVLALYLIPGLWFMRFARSPDPQQRVTAGMGLAVCLGFFVYGMTDTMFYWSFCAGFYTIAVSTLIALLIKRQEESDKTKVEFSQSLSPGRCTQTSAKSI